MVIRFISVKYMANELVARDAIRRTRARAIVIVIVRALIYQPRRAHIHEAGRCVISCKTRGVHFMNERQESAA